MKGQGVDINAPFNRSAAHENIAAIPVNDLDRNRAVAFPELFWVGQVFGRDGKSRQHSHTCQIGASRPCEASIH